MMPLHVLPGNGQPPVPVFNCVVILRPDPVAGTLVGRVANLGGISATGHTERDVLTQVAARFRTAVRDLVSRNEPIPWIDPPERAVENELERFIPVHL